MITAVILVAIFTCYVRKLFLVVQKFPLISTDKVRLRTRANAGDKRAKLVAELLRKPELLLGTTLLGTNSSTVLGSTLATYLVIYHLGETYSYIAIIVMSPLILIFAEIIPKTIAQAKSAEFAFAVVGPLNVFRRLFYPIVWILAKISRLFFGAIKKSHVVSGPLMTREDLEFALKETGRRGGLKSIEKRMIHRIFEFKDTTVGEVMIPLIEVVALDARTDMRTAINTAMKHGLFTYSCL